MSQMGMSTDLGFGSEGGRRKGDQGQSSDGQPGTIQEQVGAEADDDVPGKFDQEYCSSFRRTIFIHWDRSGRKLWRCVE